MYWVAAGAVQVLEERQQSVLPTQLPKVPKPTASPADDAERLKSKPPFHERYRAESESDPEEGEKQTTQRERVVLEHPQRLCPRLYINSAAADR